MYGGRSICRVRFSLIPWINLGIEGDRELDEGRWVYDDVETVAMRGSTVTEVTLSMLFASLTRNEIGENVGEMKAGCKPSKVT